MWPEAAIEGSETGVVSESFSAVVWVKMSQDINWRSEDDDDEAVNNDRDVTFPLENVLKLFTH